jgi:hydrogenase/urease accessory protein HupE
VKTCVWLLLALLSSLFATPLQAHESRPAYLQLKQTDRETYDVLWKVPGQGEERRLALDVAFVPEVTTLGSAYDTVTTDAFVRRWRVRRKGGLDGTVVRIDGLDGTLTDVLVRLERLDGTTRTLRVVPASPSFVVQRAPGNWEIARTYLSLGLEHILRGADHLLFVLALVLLVKNVRTLIGTITAFTAAHSLTLAAATLGWVHVPSPPVEAAIALSILFLALEITRASGEHSSLTVRKPWLFAFAFGLLHGLGFAGALGEVGIPVNAIPLALLFFNVGVEVGQASFIAVALVAIAGLRRVPQSQNARLIRVPAYAIGSLAAYWTLDRVFAFWA